jgi:hypothetical protein
MACFRHERQDEAGREAESIGPDDMTGARAIPITLLDVLGSLHLDGLLDSMSHHRMDHWPGACGVAPGDLFPVEEWEQLLLRGGLVNSGFRVTVNGFNIDLAKHRIVEDGQLRPLALRKMARQGASIIVIDLQSHVAKLWGLACDAERRLKDRVRISAVASYSKLPALVAHYDREDLLQIQIAGTKQWRFFGEPIDCGVNDHPGSKPPSEVTASVTMRPGDLMYVPSGLHHQCEAEGFSLHLALLIDHATGRDVLRDMFKEHISLNRPFRPALGGESLANQWERFRQDLISSLTAFDIASWLDSWNGARSGATRLGLVGDAPIDAPGAIASLAVSMVPEALAGRRWKAAGGDFKPGPGAAAVLNSLKAGPNPVAETLALVASDVGPEEARAGLVQLVALGIVQIEVR